MNVRIERLPTTLLIGMKTKMSFATNKTGELWQRFMPKKNEVKNSTDSNVYSVEIYPSLSFFNSFNPHEEFEKWAAVRVTEHASLPSQMEVLTIPSGNYAVFLYKGKADEVSSAYQYILGTWIPESEYVLDDRPHFALMGDKYKNNDINSEEELWIPII